MKDFRNKVAVVTGAASGIGQALAIELAKNGAQLAYCDLASLEETNRLMNAVGANYLPFQGDVSDRGTMATFRTEVLNRFGVLDLLINNAGIALGDRTFEEVTEQDFEKITGVNYWGVVHTTQLFYKDLLARPQAAVVNISSAQGVLAVPYLVPYCTTKFAVRGLTDALRVEHKIRGIDHVTIHCVHPGGIATNITKNADYQGENSQMFHDKLQKGTSAEQAAQIILDGVARNRGRIFVSDGIWNDRIARWFPNSYHILVRFFMRLRGVTVR